ncbi:hypothetical protein K3G63_10850 [Hymenobacter sp. HSC-4F20]|uniref:hypothetical protein n=1 Tax=Hymenobacter sp. HSC-4F20 TaxID=2864135 RepID=UPI001C72E23F|nr:hypothetical protein [Hymenobacter sp. HSC-4F20]MBX0290940.1 hypothetical protein [Hymenobacter sp. HSC-4F20]
MTEKLRYIGPNSVEYRTGEVYQLLISLHQCQYWIRQEGKIGTPYQTLAQLLREWEPVEK